MAENSLSVKELDLRNMGATSACVIETNQFAKRLQALDLAQVTITATIDPSGQLGPVGGLWPKLPAAARDPAALGLLRAVVISDQQSGVPPELLAPDAFPIRVIQTATFE